MTIPLEYILRRDRFIVITGLCIISILAWVYIIYLYRQMEVMDMDALFFAMPMTPKWATTDFILMFLMWLVMMIAMMTPSVAPLILLFTKVNRQKREQQTPFVNTWYLFIGYFVVWGGFSLIATILQWVLQQITWLNPDMIITNKILGSIILIAAGVFQFTPLKQTCLNFCKSPLQFIYSHWKDGKKGAVAMGIRNGTYCVGCCWVLMVLLFVSGVMNILWVALITLFVLIEKVTAKSKWISLTAGSVLIIYGVLVIVL
ncbi:MAG: metal-binding protein [Segetibacter sp.]|nr:metal-binding protein [Segetibacter sp.]